MINWPTAFIIAVTMICGAVLINKPTLPRNMFRIAEDRGARRRTLSVYHIPAFLTFMGSFRMMADANGKKHWRMGWDSNPRGALTPAGFQDRFLQPLGHPSSRLN